MNWIGRAWRVILILWIPLFLYACGSEGSDEARTAFENSKEPAALPAGHPPLTASETAAGEATSGESPSSAAGVAWTVPEGWEAQGARSMRVATYTVRTNREGTAECAVFYFGAGQGGGVQANIDRWVGQFQQPDGSPSSDKAKTSRGEKAGWPLTRVEVSGTYAGGMGPGAQGQEPQPGYSMLGAIIEGPEGPVFFKLTGPEAVVEASRDAFGKLLESIRPAG